MANAKRIEEAVILQLLLEHNSVSLERVQEYVAHHFSPAKSTVTLASCLSNLNFDFRRTHEDVVIEKGGLIRFAPTFQILLVNPIFRLFLVDAL